MNERNIAAEVLEGLREAREHRAGKLSLRTIRLPEPLPGLSPGVASIVSSQRQPCAGTSGDPVMPSGYMSNLSTRRR